MIIFKRENQKKKGFSIAEVLISVFVASAGLLAILQLINKSITYSAHSRDQIIASQLAQEGLEIVRAVRDNNILNPPSPPNGDYWKEGLDEIATGCVGILTDTQNPNFDCGGDNRLYYDINDYTYSRDPDLPPTKFYRRISISDLSSSGDEITVTSTVWWDRSSQPSDCTVASKCISIKSILMRLK